MMSNRDILRRAIPIVVRRAMRQGQPVDVTDIALHLSSRYWRSGIALDEICSEIEAAVHEAEGRPVRPLEFAGRAQAKPPFRRLQ